MVPIVYKKYKMYIKDHGKMGISYSFYMYNLLRTTILSNSDFKELFRNVTFWFSTLPDLQ